MGCNCGKNKAKVAMTSVQMQAAAGMRPAPRYQVTHTDGSMETFGLYVDARRDQVHSGGTLKEIRNA